MKNAAAALFVLVFLSACAAYTYTHTTPRPSLIDQIDSSHWREKAARDW